jgi:hypothetical protein
LIPLVVLVGPWAVRSIKGAVRPFPATCDANDELTLSGNWEGQGPIITSAGDNCKLHIKDAKLKGTRLLEDTDSVNLEITLENVTIETTDNALEVGDNVSLSMMSSTIESTGGTAIKGKYNLKIKKADNAKIRGKKAGIDTDANFELGIKQGSEVTSSDGIAIKATSSFKLDASQTKIDGASGGIVATSSTSITGEALTISSSREKALVVTSGLTLAMTDGAIMSSTDAAIDGQSGLDIALAGTKVQGVTGGIVSTSSLKLKATKKAHIVASKGNGVTTSSNADITIADSSIEAGAKALKATSSSKMKLTQGAHLAGKKGGIEHESSLALDATSASIDGGSGAAIAATSDVHIDFQQGSIKGEPALRFEGPPANLDVAGTKITGAQVFTR